MADLSTLFQDQPFLNLDNSDPTYRRVVAKREIPKGRIILSEQTQFYASRLSQNQSGAMSLNFRNFRDSNHFSWLQEAVDRELLAEDEIMVKDNPDLKKWVKIFMNNCYPIESGSDTAEFDGLFFFGSFFNHSCIPNCNHVFDVPRKTMRVTANRNIELGEELTISYFTLGDNTEDPAQLSAWFERRFRKRCGCSHCVRV